MLYEQVLLDKGADWINFFAFHADIYKCKECKMRCKEAVTMKKGSRDYSG